MKYVISKELLSTVLMAKIYIIKVQENKISFSISDRWQHINIYELAYKCKEWAYTEEFLLDSIVTQNGVCRLFTSPISEKYDIDKIFIASNEPNAIFKACQWILDQKGKL